MLNNTKALFDFLDKLFIPEGFYRKKDTYYFSTDECICFFSIGKSPFGGYYDHVMGCFLKVLMETKEEFPAFNKNHLKYSLRELANKNLVKQVLNFEKHTYKENEREKILERLIKSKALPFLKEVSTKKGILEAVEKYKDLKYLIKGDLADFLKIKYPED